MEKFNNFQIDISERAAIPKSFSFATGVDSAERLKNYLWNVIHNERANRKLYYRLLDVGFNRPVLIRDQALELLPGKFIKVYFVLRDRTKDRGPRGTSGLHGLIFKESRITISLDADVENDCILWSDKYEATIDHEITHAFQSMEVAIRYLFAKNKNIPNYKPSYDDIFRWMDKVNDKNRDFNKRFKGKEKDPNKYLAYLSSDREMGARAHALLRELAAKDRNLFNDVISFCEHGWPSFNYLNKQLSRGNWHGWSELTRFGKSEMEAFNIREEETHSYALKQELLNKLYEFYRIQYKQ